MKRYKVMIWMETFVKEPDGGVSRVGEWVPWSDDWLSLADAMAEYEEAQVTETCNIIEEDFEE